MLFSNPMNLANKKLPIKPIGTERITAKGTRKLSYKALRIK